MHRRIFKKTLCKIPDPAMSSAPAPLRLGSLAPDFSADTTTGPMGSFHAFIGTSWCILFSHPEDFTPVCTTELGAVARLAPEWAKRNVKVIGLSCNTLESHEQWIADIQDTQHATVTFPIIADPSRAIATLYQMLDHADHDPGNVTAAGIPWTVRSVYVIDPAKKIRLILTYPASCGRNFNELLRVVDSLQMTDRRGVTTPADWVVGQDCIVPPTMQTEEAKERFGEVRVVREYLRY
ncbi:antioxidant protein LsfA, partial [Catenaria anguillulae PL171]